MHTLSLSLHVVAKLLGEKVVEEELVPVFEEMIQVSNFLNVIVVRNIFVFFLLRRIRMKFELV